MSILEASCLISMGYRLDGKATAREVKVILQQTADGVDAKRS